MTLEEAQNLVPGVYWAGYVVANMVALVCGALVARAVIRA